MKHKALNNVNLPYSPSRIIDIYSEFMNTVKYVQFEVKTQKYVYSLLIFNVFIQHFQSKKFMSSITNLLITKINKNKYFNKIDKVQFASAHNPFRHFIVFF